TFLGPRRRRYHAGLGQVYDEIFEVRRRGVAASAHDHCPEPHALDAPTAPAPQRRDVGAIGKEFGRLGKTEKLLSLQFEEQRLEVSRSESFLREQVSHARISEGLEILRISLHNLARER